MRFFLFLGLLFGYLFLWLILFKPFSYKVGSKSVYNAVFQDFVYTSYSTKKTPLVLQGKRGIQKKEAVIVDDPIAQKDQEKIVARWGKYDKRTLLLRGDVRYYSKDFDLVTSKALYDIIHEKLVINAPYTIIAPRYKIKGTKIVYYKKLGTILSKNVDAIFKE